MYLLEDLMSRGSNLIHRGKLAIVLYLHSRDEHHVTIHQHQIKDCNLDLLHASIKVNRRENC